MWEFQYIFYPYLCWSFSILSPLPLLEFQYTISPDFCVSFSILSSLIFVWVSVYYLPPTFVGVSVYYLPLFLLEFQYIISPYFCGSYNMLSPLTSVGVSVYSFTLSTATMLVSNSVVILTNQFNVCVTYNQIFKYIDSCK